MVDVSSKVFEGSDVGYRPLIGQQGQTTRRISSHGGPCRLPGAGQPCLESLASPAERESMNCTMPNSPSSFIVRRDLQ